LAWRNIIYFTLLGGRMEVYSARDGRMEILESLTEVGFSEVVRWRLGGEDTED